ncbi:MAG TPA: Rieske 2Fe-2S domain-containing protein [Polyangiaceae bacterium]
MTQRTYDLGALDRVPLGEGRAFETGGRAIAVYRTRAGGLYATEARCPHKGGPLADGMTGGATVVCPLHGFAFDLTTGRPLATECAHLRTFPVRVDDAGRLLVEVDGDD